MGIATPRSEKLSFLTKLGYGYGDFGTAVVASLKVFFLLFFLTDVARLSPGAAGTVLLITKWWDAVNDPMVGWLSDRTVTRWGRRRPWLLIGALPFGILFFMLWLVPDMGETGKFIYYLVVAMLLDAAYTVVNVPYTALTPELTRDYDERTSLNSYRFAFSVFGSLISAVLHPMIVAQAPDLQTGYMISAAVWATLSTIPFFVTFAVTYERPESMAGIAEEDRIPLREQLKIVFSNRPYRFVITLYMLSWLVVQLVASVLIYYLNAYMRRPDMQSIILGALQGTNLIFIFVWSVISRRLDKRTVLMIGAAFWLVIQMAIYFLRPDQADLLVPLAVLAGIGVATAYLIPWAMMPDVIEYDELETGQRREGIFYGFMVFLQKFGLAVGLFLVGWALELAGYITPTDAVPQPIQPESALNAIRVFMGPVPAVLLVTTIIVAYFYPITREKHQAVRAALAERNR